MYLDGTATITMSATSLLGQARSDTDSVRARIIKELLIMANTVFKANTSFQGARVQIPFCARKPNENAITTKSDSSFESLVDKDKPTNKRAEFPTAPPYHRVTARSCLNILGCYQQRT